MNKNETKTRDSMVVYRTFYDVMMMMNQSDRDKFIRAVFEYGLDGKEPDLQNNSSVKMGFMFARKLIDSANERYRKSVENGKKGGAPKGNTNACKKTTQNNLKQPDSTQNNLYDNEYDNEYEDVYDNEGVYEFDTDTGTDTGTVN